MAQCIAQTAQGPYGQGSGGTAGTEGTSKPGRAAFHHPLNDVKSRAGIDIQNHANPARPVSALDCEYVLVFIVLLRINEDDVEASAATTVVHESE